MQFAKDFLWGTATSGHQTEGNNINSDWWKWENGISAKACDSYNRYEEDFNLAVQLNNNAVRIGVEWSRIEPTKGKFSQKELGHYKKVLRAAKSRNLKTFVTLHHFTSPKWVSWTNKKTPEQFANYAGMCAKEFGDLVDVYLTINEPQVYAMQSYLRGIWPPQKKNIFLSLLVQINFIRAHNKAYKIIKGVGNYKVGIVKNIVWWQISKQSKTKIADYVIAKTLQFLSSDFFLIPIKKHLDLIGLNYYFTKEIKNLKFCEPHDKISDLGWWLNPAGILYVLLNLKKYKKPIYITEHGVADRKDKQRAWWINETLKYCHHAIEQGVPLKGYFHWSLIDNYEWAEGFEPRFGLVEIGRENNLERKPRGSFFDYAEICKTGRLS